jgi:hypothetical protein
MAPRWSFRASSAVVCALAYIELLKRWSGHRSQLPWALYIAAAPHYDNRVKLGTPTEVPETLSNDHKSAGARFVGVGGNRFGGYEVQIALDRRSSLPQTAPSSSRLT